MYGVLFFDKTSAIVRDEGWTSYIFRIREYCAKKPNFGSLKTPEYVRPIVPPDYHPGLAELWEGKDDRNERELKLAHGTYFEILFFYICTYTKLSKVISYRTRV